MVQGLEEVQVVGVAAGDRHTVVWTVEGQALTFGYGYDGRMGHGEEDSEFTPRVVKGLGGMQVAANCNLSPSPSSSPDPNLTLT